MFVLNYFYMKKLFLLLFSVSLLCSCSKDDPENQEEQSSSEWLVDTKWKSVGTQDHETYVFHFTSTDVVRYCQLTIHGELQLFEAFKYELDYPNLQLKHYGSGAPRSKYIFLDSTSFKPIESEIKYIKY